MPAAGGLADERTWRRAVRQTGLIAVLLACGPTINYQDAVDPWLLCEECIEGELDSVVALQSAGVPTLVSALEGPSPDRIDNMRSQFAASYARIVARLGPGEFAMAETEYVRRFLDNYVASYQSRSAIALGRIATPQAVAALRQAAQDSTYRSDVLREIRRALANAMSVVQGGGQTAQVGATLPVDPAVVVTDAVGAPVSGIRITFTPDSRGGVVTGGTVLTDSTTGVAAVTSWTLGPELGIQMLYVTARKLADTVLATATAAPGPILTLSAGRDQAAPVSTAVPIAPSVLVTNGSGDPVGGAPVVFSVIGGGGSITAGIATTAPNGVATVGSWTMGPVIDAANLLQAIGGAVPDTVVFSAVATAPVPAAMSIAGGNGQVAMVGTPVPTAPSTLVTDASGTPLPDVAVLFSVVSGGGAVTGEVQTTNGAGIATVGGWSMGLLPGTNRLRAATLSLSGVNFTATATTGLCLGWSDLPAGGVFGVGESIVTNGVTVDVASFERADGTVTTTGTARSVQAGTAGGSGTVVDAREVNLVFRFAYPGSFVSLRFGETGGTNNLRVNGGFRNVPDVVSLDGASLAGTSLTVIATQNGSNWLGTLHVAGIITEFSIGGQEIWIDDVCLGAQP